jgi:hypothetical protein
MKWWIMVALAACGSKDPDKAGGKPATADDDKVASCSQPSIGSCREYRGGNLAAGTELIEKLCKAGDQIAKSKFALEPCPTAKVIGSCAKPEGKDFLYEGYPIPPADAEKQCKDGGGIWGK